MEWWYKSNKYSINQENIVKLQNELLQVMRDANSMRIANLYDDEKNFYIKTSNNITLHTFLFKHGFDELENEENLNLILGSMN